MKKWTLILLLSLSITTVLTACSTDEDEIVVDPVRVAYDFRQGALGWEAGFAEYAPDMEMQLDSGIRDLPDEIGIAGTGYYLQGMNRSDDLFMFLKRKIGTHEGLVPNQEYRVIFEITFASNAPSDAFGIGGPPGEAVFLKAGATPIEPEVYLDTATNYYLMTVDKGGGNSGSGPAASETGHIANGLTPEEIDMMNPPYMSLERHHVHEYTVTANSNGELWLLVGTDSGFEGLTGIYYQSISATLEPLD